MVRVKMVREETERALTESRGFTNSSIHRRELANGKGLVNGNGLVNCRGLTNGEGLINGNGLVNGRERINSRAFSDNNGLTNGNGITNGLNLKSNKFGIVAQKDIRSFIVGLVAVILVAPLVLFFLGYYNPPPPVLKVITIDGDFTDWTSIPKYSEAPAAPPDSINIREYSVDLTDEMLSFYIKVKDNFFSQEDPDIFEIFLDADGDKSTGYNTSGDFGSDYRIELYGWNASIHGSPKLTEFSGSDSLNFSAWSSIGNAKAAAHLNELEAQIDTEMLDNFQEDDFKVLIYGKDFEGREVYSSVTPSKTFGALLVEQRPLKNVTTGPGDVTELSFHARGSNVNVNGLTLTTSGGTVGSIDSFTVLAGTTIRKNVNLDVSDLSDGTLAIVNLDAVDADRPVKIIGKETRVYKGYYPSGIVVDGLFEEWKTPINISGDAVADVNNIDIDIAEYSTAKNSTNAYFFLEVSGKMLAGTNIPKRIMRPPPTVPGPPGPPAPPPVVVQVPRKSGEDATSIYMDTDGNKSTGFGLSEDFGSDYLLEIKGIHGKITNKALYNWTGSGWDPMFSPVEAEVDDTRLESSIPLTDLGMLNNPKVIFVTTDWRRLTDMSEPDEGLKSESEGTKSVYTVESTTDSGTTTAFSHQRKLFYDGSYWWSFYYDGEADPANTYYEYSFDGMDWSSTPVSAFTSNYVNYTSVWFVPPSSVYIVGDNGTSDKSIIVRNGTIVMGPSISWSSEYTVNVSAQDLPNKVAFISRDADRYLWVISNFFEIGFTFNIVANRSSNQDDISSWDSGTVLRTAGGVGTNAIYSFILPTSTNSADPNMYAIWYADGDIEGRGYDGDTGTWEATETSIVSTTSGEDRRGPSAVVDSSNTIHLIYSDINGRIRYRYNISGSGWAMGPNVEMTAINLYYPTMSIDTSTSTLYALYINTSTNRIWCKYGSGGAAGSWDYLVLTDDTNAKTYLTSVYSYTDSYRIAWQWRNDTGSGGYDITFERIPEFQEILIPISMLIAVPIFFLRRKRKK